MDAKIWIDLSLILFITVSMLVGIYRGFVREVLTLFTWIIAAVLGTHYGQEMGDFLGLSEIEDTNFWMGFAFIFVATAVIGYILKILICKLMKITGPRPLDRMTGAVFGVLRGMIFVVLILLVGADRFKDQEWYKEATLVGYFKEAAEYVDTRLPEDWRDHLK